MYIHYWLCRRERFSIISLCITMWNYTSVEKKNKNIVRTSILWRRSESFPQITFEFYILTQIIWKLIALQLLLQHKWSFDFSLLEKNENWRCIFTYISKRVKIVWKCYHVYGYIKCYNKSLVKISSRYLQLLVFE